MVAMMLPSSAPAILKAVSLAHKRPEGVGGIPTTLFFAAGYLIVWTGFSFAATLLHWALDSAHLLSETMAIRSRVVAGVLVILVGPYQLNPVEANFSPALPLIIPLPRRGSSPERVGDSAARNAARRFLPRLLLGLDVSFLRRRFDEYPLDGGSCALGIC